MRMDEGDWSSGPALSGGLRGSARTRRTILFCFLLFYLGKAVLHDCYIIKHAIALFQQQVSAIYLMFPDG